MSKKQPEIAIASDEEIRQYAPDAESGPANPEGDHGVPQEGEARAGEPTDPVEQLRAERDALKDKLLRAQAETANTAKRLHQQHAEAVKIAGMAMARDLLNVADSFERSLAHLEQAGAEATVIEGIRLIADQFFKTLADHGITPMEAVGQPFDPARHEALYSDQQSQQAPGTVSRELRRGYTMHGRVLRPAQVAVASEAPAESSDDSPDKTSADPSAGTPPDAPSDAS